VAPTEISREIARVHIYNTVTATGISQAGALAALRAPDEDFHRCRAEWERRRDALSASLMGYGVVPAAGGWSQLLDVASLGHDSFTASRLLIEHGRVAATPMRDWGGPTADRYVRLVFSNEPVERLAELGRRLATALGPPR
jgi:aspartate/methionine/tyrosine aminotransferase